MSWFLNVLSEVAIESNTKSQKREESWEAPNSVGRPTNIGKIEISNNNARVTSMLTQSSFTLPSMDELPLPHHCCSGIVTEDELLQAVCALSILKTLEILRVFRDVLPNSF